MGCLEGVSCFMFDDGLIGRCGGVEGRGGRAEFFLWRGFMPGRFYTRLAADNGGRKGRKRCFPLKRKEKSLPSKGGHFPLFFIFYLKFLFRNDLCHEK